MDPVGGDRVRIIWIVTVHPEAVPVVSFQPVRGSDPDEPEGVPYNTRGYILTSITLQGLEVKNGEEFLLREEGLKTQDKKDQRQRA